MAPDGDAVSRPTKTANRGAPQWPWGAIVVVIGVLAIVAIFAVAAALYSKASDVATAVSPVTGVVAAIVGGYFGIRGANVAQGQANEHLTAMMAATAHGGGEAQAAGAQAGGGQAGGAQAGGGQH